jgi:hypothetical protein
MSFFIKERRLFFYLCSHQKMKMPNQITPICMPALKTLSPINDLGKNTLYPFYLNRGIDRSSIVAAHFFVNVSQGMFDEVVSKRFIQEEFVEV